MRPCQTHRGQEEGQQAEQQARSREVAGQRAALDHRHEDVVLVDLDRHPGEGVGRLEAHAVRADAAASDDPRPLALRERVLGPVGDRAVVAVDDDQLGADPERLRVLAQDVQYRIAGAIDAGGHALQVAGLDPGGVGLDRTPREHVTHDGRQQRGREDQAGQRNPQLAAQGERTHELLALGRVAQPRGPAVAKPLHHAPV